MANQEEDKDSKTEEASSKKLEDARIEGDVPFSQEVGNLFILLVGGVFIWLLLKPATEKMGKSLSALIENSGNMSVSIGSLQYLMSTLFQSTLSAFGLTILLFLIMALCATFVQVGFIYSPKRIMPKWSNLSIKKGFDKIFSTTSLFEFFKSVLNMLVLSLIAIVLFWFYHPQHSWMMQTHPDKTLEKASNFLAMIIFTLVGTFSILVALDVLWTRRKFFERMRMSLRDVKDEYKELEGNPEVQGKIKALRQQRARSRMMKNVPDAAVIITNPTHYSVALKYNMETMSAPLVVAKGQDLVALKIREIARAHNIPLYENPPLARVLFANVDIDEEIPPEHYKAVAEIIRFVMNRNE